MKIAVITLHRVYNYGSALQAYATQKVIEKLGHEVEIIDYITSQRTLKKIFFKINEDKKYNVLYYIMKVFSLLLKEMTFGRFIKKNLNLTKKYITIEDLLNDPPKADIYITGSDQTWNSDYNEGIDRGFFLDFVSNKSKRISFVSSFGKDHLSDLEIEETKKYLSKYSAISVREDAAVKIVEDLKIKGAVQLIDPTLQLKKEEWLNIASKRLVKKNYLILMLLYNEDNGATEYARKIADEKNLELVKISWEMRKPKLVDKLFTHRNPADFISLFAYADFVVTNSFHGLAFSLNLHKQFIVIPRKEYNSRITSLLELVNLNERLICDEKELFNVTKKIIDYEYVEEKLCFERKKANDFMKKYII